MMKVAFTLATAGAMLGLAACANTGGPVATAQSAQCDNGMLCGDSLDKDKDGTISQSEWSAAYQSMDTNGDGVVSQSELEAASGHSGGGGGSGGGGSHHK